MNHASVLELIDSCLRLFVRKENLKIDATTALFASEGVLDSISLVSFLMELEQQLSEKFGITVRLISDKALSLKSSPFVSVGSLIDFVLESQNEQQ
jgi:D-alanine--poly(phosphoribitol) ligase subunit 2